MLYLPSLYTNMKRNEMNHTRLALPTLSVLTMTLLAACSGESNLVSGVNASSNTNDTVIAESGEESEQEPGAATGALATGRFVDSAVGGLEYETATQRGVTGPDGTFQYVPGENVTFAIGGIVLPTVAGAELISPLTVFNTSEVTDPRVMNLARLLQTLDTDGDAENGIDISPTAIASATGLNVAFDDTNFDTSVSNLVANSGSVTTTLIDAEPAASHLQETLFTEGVLERPPVVDSTPSTTDGTSDGTSSSHPLVGTVRQLSTLAHDVAGTVTILDDRTIQVTDFIFDGGGVNVFFYVGNDGRFDSAAGGRPLGPQLVGTRQTGGTITLTLPDDLTLDDFNGLSVWCVPFSASFGEVDFR